MSEQVTGCRGLTRVRGHPVNGRHYLRRFDHEQAAEEGQLAEALCRGSTFAYRQGALLIFPQYVKKYTAEAWGVSFVNERKLLLLLQGFAISG